MAGAYLVSYVLLLFFGLVAMGIFVVVATTVVVRTRRVYLGYSVTLVTLALLTVLVGFPLSMGLLAVRSLGGFLSMLFFLGLIPLGLAFLAPARPKPEPIKDNSFNEIEHNEDGTFSACGQTFKDLKTAQAAMEFERSVRNVYRR